MWHRGNSTWPALSWDRDRRHIAANRGRANRRIWPLGCNTPFVMPEDHVIPNDIIVADVGFTHIKQDIFANAMKQSLGPSRTKRRN